MHYSHFLTGSVLSLLLGLISFPILTRVLTTEEYGMLGLVTTSMLFVVALAKAGLSDGIIRFYKEYGETTERRDIFSSTVAIRGLLFSISTVLLYAIAILLTWRYLDLDAKYLLCFAIMGVYLFIRPLNIIVFNVLRATGKTIFFNFINLAGKVLSIGVSLLLLIYVVNDLYGYFIGVVIAEGVVATILFYWFLKNYSVILSRVSGNLAINLIKFGLPLLITEISFLLLTYADRYMIVGYIGKDALGLYSVGYNIASYISDALMFSLSYSIVPIYVTLYGEKGREETEVFLKSSMHYLLVFLIPICVGFTSVSNDLLVLLASEKYAHAATFSPIILIGSFFLGVNRILNAGLYLKKRTNILLAIMLTAVVINIILNVILLPIYGVTGAAIATLVACAWTTILTVVFSYKHLTIRINARLLFYHVVLSGIMFFVIEQIALSVLWIDLVVRIVTGMLIIGLGVVLIEKEIRAKIKTMLSFKKSLYETD